MLPDAQTVLDTLGEAAAAKVNEHTPLPRLPPMVQGQHPAASLESLPLTFAAKVVVEASLATLVRQGQVGPEVVGPTVLLVVPLQVAVGLQVRHT